jgi:hypothetical protein
MGLYDWQVGPALQILSPLLEKDVCIAACCTGSGKTFLALDCMKKLGGRWLVIAPKATLIQWSRVAAHEGLGDLVHCINPERISTGRSQWYDGEKWHLPTDMKGVIVDEYHRGCSGVDSKMTVAVAKLKAYRQKALFMSATPAVSPLQMRAVAWWTGVCGFDRSSFYQWCGRNGVSDVYIRDRRIKKFTTTKEKAHAHMRNIKASLGKMLVTLQPENIPGFPTETADIVYVDLSKGEVDKINEAYAEMSARLKSPSKDDLSAINRQRERIEFLMAKPLAAIVAEAGGDASVVTFWNFTEPRLRFETALKELTEQQIISVYGGQDDDERQAGIDAFMADEAPFASIMAAAGGAGISLHGLAELGRRPRESFIIPSYSASELKQCFGRIRRAGGTHATQHLVIVSGSVQEERVVPSLERKLANLDSLCDDDLVE